MTQRPVFRRFDRRLFAGAALLAVSSLAGCADTDANGTASTAPPATISSSAAEAAVPSLVADTQATEQTFASAWGPATGSQIPALAASDHAGQPQTLSSLSGDKGLLLVFSRSADW